MGSKREKVSRSAQSGREGTAAAADDGLMVEVADTLIVVAEKKQGKRRQLNLTISQRKLFYQLVYLLLVLERRGNA